MVGIRPQYPLEGGEIVAPERLPATTTKSESKEMIGAEEALENAVISVASDMSIVRSMS